MREKLIELLQEEFYDEYDFAAIADHLIENGVIVPPVKVGQTVWYQWEALLDNGTVFAIGIDGRNKMWISVRYISGLTYYHTSDDIGKTVFLTKEAAEAALKGGERG